MPKNQRYVTMFPKIGLSGKRPAVQCYHAVAELRVKPTAVTAEHNEKFVYTYELEIAYHLAVKLTEDVKETDIMLTYRSSITNAMTEESYVSTVQAR